MKKTRERIRDAKNKGERKRRKMKKQRKV